jgi:hypothetical protein
MSVPDFAIATKSPWCGASCPRVAILPEAANWLVKLQGVTA